MRLKSFLQLLESQSVLKTDVQLVVVVVIRLTSILHTWLGLDGDLNKKSKEKLPQ